MIKIISRMLVLASCLLAMSSYALAQQDDDLDCSKATNQHDINECASKDFDTADKELNQTYKAILAKYKDDALFLTQLRKAQEAWIKFRDAELDAKFPLAPGKNPRVEYGSMYSMCYFSEKAQLTRQRSEQLKDLLKTGPGC